MENNVNDKNSRKSKSGVIKLGIGAFLLLTSFLITCVNFHSNQPFTLLMYSLTTAGALLLFWGLYDLFG